MYFFILMFFGKKETFSRVCKVRLPRFFMFLVGRKSFPSRNSRGCLIRAFSAFVLEYRLGLFLACFVLYCIAMLERSQLSSNSGKSRKFGNLVHFKTFPAWKKYPLVNLLVGLHKHMLSSWLFCNWTQWKLFSTNLSRMCKLVAWNSQKFRMLRPSGLLLFGDFDAFSIKNNMKTLLKKNANSLNVFCLNSVVFHTYGNIQQL